MGTLDSSRKPVCCLSITFCWNDEMSRLLTVHVRQCVVVSLQIRNVDAMMMECKLASCTLCPLWYVRRVLLL